MMLLLWNTAPLSRWITAAIVLHLLALLPVFTTERYRLPIVPGLLVFAAFGLITFFNNVVAGKFNSVISYGALLAVSTLFVSWPQSDPSLWALDAYNSGLQALESGNLTLAEKKLLAKDEHELAREEIEIAIRLRPNQIEFQQL